MVAADRTPRRDRVAIAGSIALHLCALAALAVLPRPTFSADVTDERTLISRIVRIEHRPPPRSAQAHRALVAAVPEHTVRPVVHAAVTVEHSARKLVVAAESRAGSVPARETVHRRERTAVLAATQRTSAEQPVAAPAADAAPTTAPSASPAPSPVVAQREEGIGNFGETYPASIEPAARAPLFAGVNGIVVRITVDENGRATAIEFVRPPADVALRDELRARLLAARFIPAACNGLRCAGTVELRN